MPAEYVHEIKLPKKYMYLKYQKKVFDSMRGSRKFCQRGSKFFNVFFCIFLVDEGIEDLNITINGSSSARQRNADGGATLNAGLAAL